MHDLGLARGHRHLRHQAAGVRHDVAALGAIHRDRHSALAVKVLHSERHAPVAVLLLVHAQRAVGEVLHLAQRLDGRLQGLLERHRVERNLPQPDAALGVHGQHERPRAGQVERVVVAHVVQVTPHDALVVAAGLEHVLVALDEAVAREAAVAGVEILDEPRVHLVDHVAALAHLLEAVQLLALEQAVHVLVQAAVDLAQRVVRLRREGAAGRVPDVLRRSRHLLGGVRERELAARRVGHDEVLAGFQLHLEQHLAADFDARAADEVVRAVVALAQHREADVEVLLRQLDALILLVHHQERRGALRHGQDVRGRRQLARGGLEGEAALAAALLPRVTRLGQAAHVDGAEELEEVLVGHPEGAVVDGLLRDAQLGAQGVSPQRRRVAPVAVPLEGAPRVAQLQQLVAARRRARLDQRVRVASHQPGPARRRLPRLGELVLAGRGGRHEIAQLVPLLQVAPELAAAHVGLHALVFQPHARARRAGHVHERLIRPAAAQRVVRAVQLGEGLLEQQHPQLVAVRLGVHGPSLGEAGEVVIEAHELPLAVLAQAHLVHTVVVAALDRAAAVVHDEHLLDFARALRQRRHRAQQPAVAQRALADVVGLDGALEHVVVALHEVHGPAPRDRVLAARVAALGRQRVLRRRELDVDEVDVELLALGVDVRDRRAVRAKVQLVRGIEHARDGLVVTRHHRGHHGGIGVALQPAVLALERPPRARVGHVEHRDRLLLVRVHQRLLHQAASLELEVVRSLEVDGEDHLLELRHLERVLERHGVVVARRVENDAGVDLRAHRLGRGGATSGGHRGGGGAATAAARSAT
mmetsp:Transcript_24054/g.83486  ORF Transcript_24054/g.83486 Transcript_24054/m.83486 type:complete len:815 (+) Transcript_24054:196-2640(+)